MQYSIIVLRYSRLMNINFIIIVFVLNFIKNGFSYHLSVAALIHTILGTIVNISILENVSSS